MHKLIGVSSQERIVFHQQRALFSPLKTTGTQVKQAFFFCISSQEQRLSFRDKATLLLGPFWSRDEALVNF